MPSRGFFNFCQINIRTDAIYISLLDQILFWGEKIVKVSEIKRS